MALNREQKRLLKKQGDLGEDGEPTSRPRSKTRPAAKAPVPKEQRTTTRVFVKEVRGELRKVAWPTRKETLQYSGVVAFTLVLLTTFIFGLDYVFSNVVLKLFGIQ
jgi:preprotein translocase subunit SecE